MSILLTKNSNLSVVDIDPIAEIVVQDFSISELYLSSCRCAWVHCKLCFFMADSVWEVPPVTVFVLENVSLFSWYVPRILYICLCRSHAATRACSSHVSPLLMQILVRRSVRIAIVSVSLVKIPCDGPVLSFENGRVFHHCENIELWTALSGSMQFPSMSVVLRT